MSPDDTLIDFFQASYREQIIGKLKGGWSKGWAYFTEERIIIFVGFFCEGIIIPYNNIRELKKYKIFMLPMGIEITHEELNSEIYNINNKA